MVTPNRFTVYLGGALVATAWSLHAANEKLTAAVLVREHERGSFPVDGQIHDSQGKAVKTQHFNSFLTFDDDQDDEAFNQSLGIFINTGDQS